MPQSLTFPSSECDLSKHLNEAKTLGQQKSVMLRETARVSDLETVRNQSTFLLQILLCKKWNTIKKQTIMSILKLLKRFPEIKTNVGHTFLDLAMQRVSQDPGLIVAGLSKIEIREAISATGKAKVQAFVQTVVQFARMNINNYVMCLSALDLLWLCLDISKCDDQVIVSSILKPIITMEATCLIQHRVQVSALRIFVRIASKGNMTDVLSSILNKKKTWISDLDRSIRVIMMSMILNHCENESDTQALVSALVQALQSSTEMSSLKLSRVSSKEALRGIMWWLTKCNNSKNDDVLHEKIMNATLAVLRANLSLPETNDIVRHMLRLETCRKKMLHVLFHDRSRVMSKTHISAACIALESVDCVDTLFENTSNWIDDTIKQIVLGQRALTRLLITFVIKSRTSVWIDPFVCRNVQSLFHIRHSYRKKITRTTHNSCLIHSHSDTQVQSLRSTSSKSVKQERVLTFIAPAFVRRVSEKKFRAFLETVRLERRNIPRNEVTTTLTFLSWSLVDESSEFTMSCARYGMGGFEHALVTLLHLGIEENKLNASEVLRDGVALGAVKAQIKDATSSSRRVAALKTCVSMLRFSKTSSDVQTSIHLIRDFLDTNGLVDIQENDVAVCERLWKLLRDRLRFYLNGRRRRRKRTPSEILTLIEAFLRWLARDWIPRVLVPSSSPEMMTTCLNLCRNMFELEMWSVSEREIFLSALVRCVHSRWKQVRYASADLLAVVLAKCHVLENPRLLEAALRLGSSLEQRKAECGGAIVSLVCCLFDPKKWPSNSESVVPSSFVKDLNDVEMQMRVSIQSSQAKDDRKKKENNSLNNLVTFVRQRIKEMAHHTQEQTESRSFPCAHGLVFGIRDMLLKMRSEISCAQVDCVLALCFECVTFGLIGIATCSAQIRNEKKYLEPNFSFLRNDSSSSSSSHVATHCIRAMSDIPLKSGNLNANDNELSQTFFEGSENDKVATSYEKQIMSNSWLVVKESLLTLQTLFRTQSTFVVKLQPENIVEVLICALFRTSHDGILTETQSAIQDLYRYASSSDLLVYSRSRLDDVLSKLECLLDESPDVKSAYDFEINFTTLRRSAGFPLAVTALTSFCKDSSQFRVSVPRLLGVAQNERFESENVVSAVVCATNALRVLLSATAANVSSFQPYVGAITSLAIRNLKSRNYSVRASSLHLYGVAIRKVLGANIVKWAPRAVDAPYLNTIEQRYPQLIHDILTVLRRAVKMRSQPTDLVASLVFLRRADVSAGMCDAKMSEIERTALELARHAKSWRVRAKASGALCSISDSRVLCEIIIEEARLLEKIECVVKSRAILFRDTNRVHGSLLILEHIIQEMSRRNVEDAKRCRDIVARSLKRRHDIWFESDVVIACEIISSAFWNLVASITLPNAVLGCGVIGADLVREMNIGLSNVSTSYGALGTYGDVDRIHGGWHSCTWSAIPDDLLRRKRRFETKENVMRRTLMWKQSSSSELENLREMANRTATSRSFKRTRSLDLESVSLSHFLVRSMLLDRAVSNLSHFDFMSSLSLLRSISPVSMKSVNGILELLEIHYGSSVARSLLAA